MNLELASIPKVRRNACITFTKVSSVVNNSILVKAHLSLPMKSCQQRQQWCQSAQIIYPNDKIESITCTRVVKKRYQKANDLFSHYLLLQRKPISKHAYTKKKGCKGRYIELRKKREADDALWQNANCLFFVHYL